MTPRTRRPAAALLLLALAALAAGCKHTEPPETVVLWVDATNSTRADKRNQREAATETIRYAAPRKAELLFERITGASGNPVWRRFRFEVDDVVSPIAEKQELIRQAAAAVEQVDREIARPAPRRGSSDILGALAGTAQTVATLKGRVVAVFVTDMLDSRVVATGLRRKKLDRLRAHLRRTGEVPSLRRVDLHFVIAAQQARDWLSQRQLVELERFWRKVVRAAGAPGPRYSPLFQLDDG